MGKDYGMHFYQINFVVKEHKTDEFIDSLRTLSRRFRREKGCFSYSMFHDSEKENTYSVVGEWKTHQAME